jgi:AcrR family transcriptional regulator
MAKPGSKRGSGPAGSGAAETRAALIQGAIDALRDTGYAGASAREIARRAGCNQALIFYHFGSVDGLLLAALDEVSAVRLAKYQASVQRSGSSLTELVKTARSVFDEDLDRGYVAVLVAMIAGAQSSPALGAEVAARLAPWREFAAESLQPFLGGTPLAGMIRGEEIAHAIVALYLGLEMLASLDGDRAAALALFDRARRAASLLDLLGAASSVREQR